MTGSPASLYLDLLERVLTRQVFDELLVPVKPDRRRKRLLLQPLQALARRRGFALGQVVDTERRFLGEPAEAESERGSDS